MTEKRKLSVWEKWWIGILITIACFVLVVSVTIFVNETRPLWNIVYTVTFNANNGTGVILDTQIYEVVKIPLLKNSEQKISYSGIMPSLERHTFLGWCEDSTATVATWALKDTVIIEGNTTLYAIWTPLDIVPPVDRSRTPNSHEIIPPTPEK